MKPLFFILIVCLAVTVSSCSNQNDEASEAQTSIAQKIVLDPQYEVYRNQEFINQKNVVEGNYDLEGIGQVVLSKSISICNIPDELFSSLRGGLMYKDIHCKLYTAVVYLNNTYPGFKEMDQNQLLTFYKLNHPDFEAKVASLGFTPRVVK